MTQHTLLRGPLFTCLDDPGEAITPAAGSTRYLEDGGIWIVDGQIHAVDPFATLADRIPPEAAIVDYRGKLMMPGFIDSHVHYVQLDVMASYGRQLLDWLNDYTFPAECRFADEAYAGAAAERFLDELLRTGTTTAQVFCSSHPVSVDRFFEASARRRLRMIAGKVLMDRNAPEELTDDTLGGVHDSERLIADWHGRDRLSYTLTPRFAPTSSREQLDAVGGVLRNAPDLHLQTHLSENRGEIAWVGELFPERRDYLDVYEYYGLVGPKSTFAHGVHLDADQHRRLAAQGANVAFCPTSNLFLGSGLMDRQACRDAGLATSLASDIGAGTSLSTFGSLQGAYQVGALLGQALTGWQGFYQATLGNARALRLDDRIGTLQPGREADIVVLDPDATPLLSHRLSRTETLAERLFALMMLGDDRTVAATWADGRCVHTRS
ncbi:guanine deaminase [Salinicola halophilus]|uniref:guanine deaminase n=1 Tax=Salinicola halophilus TaxID=184065 RepID=UPI000DA1BE9D|nr:guanine deaminase [Salinicola halophilus]